ncbi:TetR/AcrR family transcriptional regulator [Paenibacillus alvei]|uniref:TetR/AcrR family transcriptional regulator n=1 Tax=Paenibacillus alvei TaxID=44250 RepID=A0AAP7A186_PAEAL|nr:TetR/AcrR family transcriptional regulator [Paenibacillus alvei]EJW17652.1 transcriptional regulator [Paenibacillus alvei DSM 29]MCY9540620.1 TetR/AcrR family transcriptional regulator [Paenibacillus alvei]MCY9577853.1 TetR/AcrR family transcriptional regulator [Paenibacillus alvei]MCY9586977.1 TetR/AcrR family transcriptional regulator [Paenibacillus alvei]MCY9707021.1 TetR/AcrR family transcriptional regulator [Paenibacillus alvei]
MSYGQSDKLQLIMNAAYELFGSNGFYETKMSEIADKAGIAKGTLYLYFESKEQLFAAIIMRSFEQFLQELDQGLLERDTFEGSLTFIAEHHLEHYYKRREYTKLFFKAPNKDPEMMGALCNFMQSYVQRIASTMENFDLPDPLLHAKSFIGMLDMLKMDILFDPTFSIHDLRRRIQFASELFQNGCKQGMPLS